MTADELHAVERFMLTLRDILERRIHDRKLREAIADDLEHAYGAFKGTEAPLRLCDPPGDGRQGGG